MWLLARATSATKSCAVPLTFATNPEVLYLRGKLDEVRLWNCARTAAQIRAAMGNRLRRTEAGLIGYWPLDEGVGDVAIDRSGLGHHGQLGTLFGPDAAEPSWTTDVAPLRR